MKAFDPFLLVCSLMIAVSAIILLSLSVGVAISVFNQGPRPVQQCTAWEA